MKSIAIVTDSNCGMSPAQANELGIYMLPMPFFIDDKEYLEDIDMNQAQFFQHLEQNPSCRVSTSQPTPESVTTLWDKLLKDYDEIVHIPMSSGLSSSMQTAHMLAEDYDGHVRDRNLAGRNPFRLQHLHHRGNPEIPETGWTHHPCCRSHRNHASPETDSSDPGRKTGRLLQSPHHDPGQKHHDQSHQR